MLKKSEYLSALAIRLVYLTGKANIPMHPKHLVKKERPWFSKYLDSSDTVLDLGCGIGSDTIKSAKLVKAAIGLDFDRSSISIAKNIAREENVSNVTFSLYNLNKKLTFPENTFDKVICSDVLEHLEKRDKALNEIKRVLKNKGLLLLVVDNPDTNWKKLQKTYGLFYYADPDHKYEYPKNEIVNKLKNKNFEIVSTAPVTYDSPFKGFLDLTGGISLSVYKFFSKRKQKMLKKYPNDTTGYKIVAQIFK